MSNIGTDVGMRFNLSQLLREPGGSTRVYEINEQIACESGQERLLVKGKVELLRTDKGVWVSAALGTEVLCTCSRCLKQYSQAIGIRIEEEALPQLTSESNEGAVDLDELEEGPIIDERHILDLLDTVRQYASLGIPMKPVCQDDCKGLCRNCGTDLNESSCRCEAGVIDARWAPLFELVSSNESNQNRID